MLCIATWLWGTKYTLDDVRKLKEGVNRHLKQPHRFLLMTERERGCGLLEGVERHAIKDPGLLGVRGCFVRLRMFDYGWQQNRKIDDRLACMDLDTIVTGPLDPLFDRSETFVILGGANSKNPCPYNGSIIMLRPGYHGEVWTDFTLAAAQALPYYEFPDDQGWLAHKIPNAATWPAGRKSGIYAFHKPGWPWQYGDRLPENARIVVFPGARQPGDFKHLPWVKEHWR